MRDHRRGDKVILNRDLSKGLSNDSGLNTKLFVLESWTLRDPDYVPPSRWTLGPGSVGTRVEDRVSRVLDTDPGVDFGEAVEDAGREGTLATDPRFGRDGQGGWSRFEGVRGVGDEGSGRPDLKCGVKVQRCIQSYIETGAHYRCVLFSRTCSVYE